MFIKNKNKCVLLKDNKDDVHAFISIHDSIYCVELILDDKKCHVSYIFNYLDTDRHVDENTQNYIKEVINTQCLTK